MQEQIKSKLQELNSKGPCLRIKHGSFTDFGRTEQNIYILAMAHVIETIEAALPSKEKTTQILTTLMFVFFIQKGWIFISFHCSIMFSSLLWKKGFHQTVHQCKFLYLQIGTLCTSLFVFQDPSIQRTFPRMIYRLVSPLLIWKPSALIAAACRKSPTSFESCEFRQTWH